MPEKVICLSSSEDEPILAFVRERLGIVRSGMSYLQIAGGDGVHVIACLRLQEGRAALPALSLNSHQRGHNSDTVEKPPVDPEG
jgi:hypothetical protein